MKWVSNAAQMRAMEQAAIGAIGVPGVCLMELAAQAVAVAIRRHHPARARCGVVVVCGPGNNGGDGYAIARWLKGYGYPVSIWSLSPESYGDAAVMRASAQQCEIPTVSGLNAASLVVDAIWGTGLTREASGAYADVIRAMNDHPAPIVSVDIPSGLYADSGVVAGVAIRASLTISFGRLKPAHLSAPGADYSGHVEVADIGLGCIPEQEAVAEIPDAEDLADLWPRRRANDHKNRSGHLLILAGSRSMAGAAILTCEGALAAGVGLLTLAAPKGALVRMGQLPPEVMVIESGDGDRLKPLPDAALDRRDAVVAGPGLGGGFGDLPRETADWLRSIWSESPLPVLFDADALPCVVRKTGGPRVMTPHPGEAGRILGCSAADVQSDRFGSVQRLAEFQCTALLKGPYTLVSHPGHRISVNTTGGPVLATGGSGDVLAGVVGALLARGLTSRDAAILGAYVHGRAGDRLARRRIEGWRARDVAAEVPLALQEMWD
jgi:hydroxyethylthiazole kinase-like uncharacterized protein yjeF